MFYSSTSFLTHCSWKHTYLLQTACSALVKDLCSFADAFCCSIHLLCFSCWHLCSTQMLHLNSRWGALLRSSGETEEEKSSLCSEMCLIFHADKLQQTHSSYFCYVCSTAVKFEVNCCHTRLHTELEVASGLMPSLVFLCNSFHLTFWLLHVCHLMSVAATKAPRIWTADGCCSSGLNTRTTVNTLSRFSKEKCTILTFLWKIAWFRFLLWTALTLDVR